MEVCDEASFTMEEVQVYQNPRPLKAEQPTTILQFEFTVILQKREKENCQPSYSKYQTTK